MTYQCELFGKKTPKSTQPITWAQPICMTGQPAHLLHSLEYWNEPKTAI